MSKVNITGGRISLGGTNDTYGTFQVLTDNGNAYVLMEKGSSVNTARVSFKSYSGVAMTRVEEGHLVYYEKEYASSTSYEELLHFGDAGYVSDNGKGVILIGNDAISIKINANQSASSRSQLELYKNSQSEYVNSTSISYMIAARGNFYAEDSFYAGGSATICSNLTVKGTKNRAVSTPDYSDRLLYCYETPSPLFGDVGEGVIGEDGKCFIAIDPIFAETVTLKQYQVFLQKYGAGECCVSERKGAYFVVEGTPNLSFGWELKAKQADFDQIRLEKYTNEVKIANTHNYGEEAMDVVAEQTKTDYGQEAINHINEIKKERDIA